MGKEVDYDLILNKIGEGGFIYAGDGKVIDVNEECLDLIGMKRDEFLSICVFSKEEDGPNQNGKVFDFFDEDDLIIKSPDANNPFFVAISQKKPVRNVICGLYNEIRKNKVWVHLNAVPIVNDDNKDKIDAVIVTLHDITDLKRKQEIQLQQSISKSENWFLAEQMRCKREVVATRERGMDTLRDYNLLKVPLTIYSSLLDCSGSIEGGVWTSVSECSRILAQWNAFDPFHSEVIDAIATAFEKTTNSNLNESSLVYWLSYGCNLYQEFRKEVPPTVDFDDPITFPEVFNFFGRLSNSLATTFSSLVEITCKRLDHLITCDILQLGFNEIQKKRHSDLTSHFSLPSVFRCNFCDPNWCNPPAILSCYSQFAECLDSVRELFEKNYVSKQIVDEFFKLVLNFIDAQLFNSLVSGEWDLLAPRDVPPAESLPQSSSLLTASKGFHIKIQLSKLEECVSKREKRLHPLIRSSFPHIREATTLLSMADKSIVLLDTVTPGEPSLGVQQRVFSNLNIVQIHRICSHFQHDDLVDSPVSSQLIEQLENLISSKNGEELALFLDESIPRDPNFQHLLCEIDLQDFN